MLSIFSVILIPRRGKRIAAVRFLRRGVSPGPEGRKNLAHGVSRGNRMAKDFLSPGGAKGGLRPTLRAPQLGNEFFRPLSGADWHCGVPLSHGLRRGLKSSAPFRGWGRSILRDACG